MRRVCVLLVALALTGVAMPSVSAKETTEGYLPGFGVTIWCSAHPHPILPTGDPEPTEDPLNWVFSGEPECLHQDLVNAAREAQGQERTGGGIGGVAVFYDGEDVGKTLVSTPADGFSGTQIWHTLRAYAGSPESDVHVEGCGVLSAVLPEPESYWQPGPEPVVGILWDIVDPVGIDADLTLCTSSAGEIHFVW